MTGVSGSGRNLVDEILNKALKERLYKAKSRPGDFDEIIGIEHIVKVINIDQSPIGEL